MKNTRLWNIYNNIDCLDKIYAHTKDAKADEKLSEHMEKTKQYLYDLMDKKGINKVLSSIIEDLCIEGRPIEQQYIDFLKELYINAVYLHDIGKINPAFQRKLGNFELESFEYKGLYNSDHSLLSALIYIHIYTQRIGQIQDRDLRRFLHYTIYTFAYIISKHHSQLSDMAEFLNSLNNLLQNEIQEHPEYLYYYKDKSILNTSFKDDVFIRRDKYMPELLKANELSWYILNKLLFTLITGCDFYATYSYTTGYSVDYGLINDVDSLINSYKDTDIYKSIESYRNNRDKSTNTSINALRTELFIEAESSLLDNINSNLFYLEAPTGSGKTNTSINLALNIIKNNSDYNKIFYIFPFNTLVEQTKKTIDMALGKSSIKAAVINSITPIIQDNEDEVEDDSKIYQKHLINRQFLNYPIVLTTHVNFFSYLFGTCRDDSFPLIHLCNSVVIIDEIQSYKNSIWMEIVMFLERYSKLLNIKLIIMSATLPKLDRLISYNHEVFIELLKGKEKYYKNDLFKSRVMLDYTLLEAGKMTIEQVFDKITEIIQINGQKRYLIEFITKSSANSFYKMLKEKYCSRNVRLLTGDDSILERSKILKELNAKNADGEYICKDIILVATQVIEAGVDIDMDVGFKDISMLDNEEQFLGRINRSCLKEGCIAYFFCLDDARKVYKDDCRLEKSLYDEEYRAMLENKSFEKHYEYCFETIEEKKNRCNADNIGDMIKEAVALKYKDIEKRMKLIDQEYYRLFLAHRLINEENGEEIDGRQLWSKYKETVMSKEIDYAEKVIKLSEINEKMNYFIYNYSPKENGEGYRPWKNKPCKYCDSLGDIFYIDDGEVYIFDGKFDREKYKKDSESDIL
ncbi:MAG: CRISPR-associated helicase Cas3' [Bacillota bacterium]